jgi:peptidoglycan/LPS O-acetylase OafA/YrhL
MGSFRFLLAAAVMLSHFAFYPNALPYQLPGDIAVEAFYVISGFLITLVLSKKYGDSLFTFYTNRALRIFPIYWIAVLLYLLADTFIALGYAPAAPAWGVPYYQEVSAWWGWQQNSGAVSPLGVLAVVATNVAILGQDILAFVHKDGSLSATDVDLFYHKFIVIKVAWTIAIELMFYAIAPFIVRRFSVVAAICGFGIVSQILCYAYSPISPGWFSRIFPFALTFFMAGSIAYRGYVWLEGQRHSRAVDLYVIASCLVMILLTVLYPSLPFGRVVYLTATTICLPGIVVAGQRFRFDGVFGDLSYPIYLVHPLFMMIFLGAGRPTVIPEILAIAGTLLICTGLVYLVERPIDRYRQARVHGVKIAARRTVSSPVHMA